MLLVVGEDRVVASAPISFEGGKFLAMWGDVDVVAAADVNIAQAVMFMARGVVAIQPNLTAALDADQVWDTVVPKDEAFSATAAGDQIDHGIEPGDAVTAAFNTPGIPNITYLAEANGIWGKRVYDMSEILTFSKTSDGFKDASPDTYIPNLSFGVMAKHVVVMDDVPGYAMLAIGNPGLTNTTSTIQPVLAGREYLMLRHLTRLIEDAWKQFAGLDEVGAESPFVDLAALIVELTEPLMIEETSGAWGATSYNVWSQMNMVTEVPRSNIVPATLSSG